MAKPIRGKNLADMHSKHSFKLFEKLVFVLLNLELNKHDLREAKEAEVCPVGHRPGRPRAMEFLSQLYMGVRMEFKFIFMGRQISSYGRNAECNILIDINFGRPLLDNYTLMH